MSKAPRKYTIEEVYDVTSPYQNGMKSLFLELFPDLTPAFERILVDRVDAKGRIKAQIFVGLCQATVAGLLQVFYRPWRSGLIGNVDLVGVLEPFRKTGLGLGLMRHAISTFRKVASQWELAPIGLLWLTGQDEGPVDSWLVRRVRMYEQIGAQVRRDLRYKFNGQAKPNGELILWYPVSDEFVNVETKSLAWQLWQFGQLPKEDFTKRYGRPSDLKDT